MCTTRAGCVLEAASRCLSAGCECSELGVLTKAPGSPTNDFFVSLLDFGHTWKPVDDRSETFECFDDATGEKLWTGSRVDLVFGTQLRVAGSRGGLRSRRREGQVRGRLRRGMGEGSGARPLRHLIHSLYTLRRQTVSRGPPPGTLRLWEGRSIGLRSMSSILLDSSFAGQGHL